MLKTRNVVFADDQVVVDCEVEPVAAFLERAGNVYVFLRGIWISAGVVVNQYERAGPQIERMPNNFSGIHRSVIDSAFLMHLIGQ